MENLIIRLDSFDQFLPAAAKYLAEGLAKYNDPIKALMYYHGGPDTKQWGPITNAYPNTVAKYYQMLISPPDAPIDIANSAQPTGAGTNGIVSK